MIVTAVTGGASGADPSGNSIADDAAIHLASAPPVELEYLTLYPLSMVALSLAVLSLFLFMRWHQFRPLQRSEPIAIALPFMLFFLMLVVEGVGVRIAAGAGGIDLNSLDNLPPRDSIHAMTVLKSAEYAAVLPLLIVAFWWQNRLRSLRWRMPEPPRAAIFIGVGALALAWPTVSSTGFGGALFEHIVTGAPPDVIAHRTLEDLAAPGVGPTAVWPLIVLVVVGAAIFEETLYRGLLQESAKRLLRHRWAAIGAASLMFTLMHIGAVGWSALPALFVLSLWLGWAYEKSDSLWPPIAAHMMFNAANILLATAPWR